MDKRMVALLTEVKESLERQIEQLTSRFDAQAIRLDPPAALLQTGARWTNRMIAWSENIERDCSGCPSSPQAEDTRMPPLEMCAEHISCSAQFILWLFAGYRLGRRGGVEFRPQKAGFQPQCKFMLPKPVISSGIAAGF